MPEEDALTTLVWKNPFPVHAAIARKSAVIKVGMFDESRAIHEDWDLWLRLALCGSKFRYLPGYLSHYHQEFSTISMDPELMFDRGKNLLEKHLENPDFEGREWHKNRFAASQYIFLANVARNQGCWKEGRFLLSKAAAADRLSLDLRLWLYFPESFVRPVIDRISGNVRVVPRNIRLAIEPRAAKA
jgi:GT2 family glycosyltransferase